MEKLSKKKKSDTDFIDPTSAFTDLIKKEFQSSRLVFVTTITYIYNNLDHVYLLLHGVFWEYFKINNNNLAISYLYLIYTHFRIPIRIMFVSSGLMGLLTYIVPHNNKISATNILNIIDKIYSIMCVLSLLLTTLLCLPTALVSLDILQMSLIIIILVVTLKRRYSLLIKLRD